MASTIEQVETMLAREVGNLQTDIAALRGDVQNLTNELRLDRLARERIDEAQARINVDVETRLRAQEARKTISPWQLWLAVSGFTLIVIGAAGVIVNAIK